MVIQKNGVIAHSIEVYDSKTDNIYPSVSNIIYLKWKLVLHIQ